MVAQQLFDKYVGELNRLYAAGQATEHSYRPALQDFLTHLLKDVSVTNEPKRQKCGAPDYILTRRKIDIGYIEAKDVGVDLDRVERGGKDDDQWKRYSTSLDNIILTDYLEFRFFLNGQKVETIRLAEPVGRSIVAKHENFDRFQNLIIDFAAFQGQTIKSAKKLAEMMARKAALMRDVFQKAVSDESAEQNSLKDQLTAFKTVLVHDMDEAQFADVYAQTIAYGLFTARLHDETLGDFSRGEALTLIPKSNPFLRQLFHYVAGPDLDDRVVWIVDALCEVYRAADLQKILKDFGSATGQNDPMLHFYETFLAEYDPKLRKARGVWYTPEPVVRFIVRAIDDVLKSHFGLKDGIAHTGTVEIEVDGHAKGKPIKIKQQVHKVQLLDVATGTGTFLAEVIKQLYARFKGQEGMWSGYVDQHLLPRLHGFELLMASYAMCHMKLDLLLKETGYAPAKAATPPRLSVYLTNSLEEHHPDSGTLFASWLSREANEASRIKKDMPIMVAFGNPPYSGISSNMKSWVAQNKIEDYKYVDGVHINEKKHWLNDDYVQFIRLGEHYIEKNGEGILAYITNHGYLDNPTFRGMRWHLLKTFTKLYILDLHGNSKRNEVSPDGLPDQNVFNIQQGVSILIAVKEKSTAKPTMASVFLYDVWGDRDKKSSFLNASSLPSVLWKEICPQAPHYFFCAKDDKIGQAYNAFISINDLFLIKNTGLMTSRDDLVTDFSRDALHERIQKVFSGDYDHHFKEKFNVKDSGGYKLLSAIKTNHYVSANVIPFTYRPFDNKWLYYQVGFTSRPAHDVMQHIANKTNIALLTARSNKSGVMDHFFISKYVSEVKTAERTTGSISIPLYTFNSMMSGEEVQNPNLDPVIYKAIQKIVTDVTPESLFDYIYAVLHSRAYRTRYAEFLKSDFPRIPYPKDKATFHALAAQGGKLRALHLMESPVLDKLITLYPVSGDHEVVALRFEPSKGDPAIGRVWINPTQYFDYVPLVAWEFYIGGYQPAQKWLKDRKGRKLTSDDLMHWQRIIVALTETDKVMSEIDTIPFLP